MADIGEGPLKEFLSAMLDMHQDDFGFYSGASGIIEHFYQPDPDPLRPIVVMLSDGRDYEIQVTRTCPHIKGDTGRCAEEES